MQHPVYCVNVVGTQNAHNLISISTDGKMCSWSLDMLSQPQVGTAHHVGPNTGTSLNPFVSAATFFLGGASNVNPTALPNPLTSNVNHLFKLLAEFRLCSVR